MTAPSLSIPWRYWHTKCLLLLFKEWHHRSVFFWRKCISVLSFPWHVSWLYNSIAILIFPISYFNFAECSLMNKVYRVSYTMRKGKNRLPFIEKESLWKLHLLPSSVESAQSFSLLQSSLSIVCATVSFVSMPYIRSGIPVPGLATLHGATVPRKTQTWKATFRSFIFLLFCNAIHVWQSPMVGISFVPLPAPPVAIYNAKE